MSQQEAATDRLVEVIQSIQVAQDSGVLIVRRGEGRTLEEGTIVFVNGQVTQSAVERRSDKAALNWLSTWGQCRYIYIPSTAPGVLPERPEIRNTPPPISDDPTSTPRPRVTDTLSRIPISPLRRQTEPQEVAPSGQRDPLVNERSQVVPQSILVLNLALRRIEQGKLTRSHRQLFLLVDGQRSSVELARLVGKSQGEVYELLRDLERVGVIHLGGK